MQRLSLPLRRTKNPEIKDRGNDAKYKAKISEIFKLRLNKNIKTADTRLKAI